MNPDRNTDIEIFNAALAIEPDTERKRYLDQACAGDPERRQRIEALLGAYSNVDSVFDAYPQTNQAKSSELRPLSEGPGAKIGPYKLLQEIGEGGMGVVYMAQQEEPVQRKVALKIIKVGMDTRQVVARFEAERQALAMMDHPNIAKVFDGGSTESGRPYFVMELVQGVPITEFCDKNKLSTQERIQLLIPVCQAIQSAHQKGIIHRDIKPSNVLVTLHHGEPQVMVIDFGVAKATNQKLTEKTLFTNFGMMIGTPAYMSPEQAQMSTMDVDTRTDVYSLGVLFYELLTGTTPFDQKQLLSKGYGEMRRIIAEDEPDKPSLRMSTLAEEKRTAIAKSRSLKLPELLQNLRGDLDCITMKCLEKDRRRRYDTPNELIADLKRYLSHETVSAAPPTVTHRFQKFYQRKKVLVHAVAAIGLTLILATVVSVGLAFRMSQLRNEAVQAGKKALTQAAVADAVNKFLNEDLLKQAEAWNEPDPDIKLRTVVDRAAQAVESKFEDQPLVEAAIRLTLCEIFRSFDDKERAKYHGDRAREIYERELGKEHPETLKATVAMVRSLVEEGNTNKARFAEACKTASDLLVTCRRVLGEEHLTTLAAIRELADALDHAGRHREQEPILKEAIALHEKVLGEHDPRTLGLMSSLSWNRSAHSSQLEEAVRLAREVVRRSEKLPTDHPFRYSAKNSLAATLSWTGQTELYYEERRQLAEENLKFARRVYGPRHRKTINALETRASSGRNLQEMLDFSAEGHRLALDHYGPKHLRTLQLQKHLAFALGLTPNRHPKAEELFLSGIEVLKANFGRSEGLLRDYLLELGDLYARTNPEKAESYFKETAEIALETQGEQSLHYDLALTKLAGLYSQRSAWRTQAIEIYRQALKLRKDKGGIRSRRTTEIVSVLAQNVAEAGRPTEADDSIGEAADAFAKSWPHSDEEWDSFRKLLQAVWYSGSKKKLLDFLRGAVSDAPKSSAALTAVAEFHRVADDLQAAHKAYQALSRGFPDNHGHWLARSAAAIEAGDIKDHLLSSREMLKRFGNEEKMGGGRMNATLRTFFLVPDRWTSDELAAAQRIYDQLKLDNGDPVAVQVGGQAVLALVDYRLNRVENGLEQLRKVPLEKPDFRTLPFVWGEALAVAALCHGALGHYDKAAEALNASKKAVEKVPPTNYTELTRLRYLIDEATQLLEGKKPGEPSVAPTRG